MKHIGNNVKRFVRVFYLSFKLTEMAVLLSV